MINKQKIYVEGPYSNGDTVSNIREAIQEADILLEYGFIPFVPHLTGFWHLLIPHTYDKWMEYDSEWLKSCDAVLRILGDSAGADQEVLQATELKLPVFFSRYDLVRHFMENN